MPAYNKANTAPPAAKTAPPTFTALVGARPATSFEAVLFSAAPTLDKTAWVLIEIAVYQVGRAVPLKADCRKFGLLMISDITLEGTAFEKAATTAVKTGLAVRKFW